MHDAGCRFLKVLINQTKNGVDPAFFAPLPEKEQNLYVATEVKLQSIEDFLKSGKKIAAELHYSWIRPLLSHVPAEWHEFVIASLPPMKAKGLCKLLGRPLPQIKLAEPLKKYFYNMIARQMDTTLKTPLSQLRAEKLGILLKLKKAELVQLMNFLGLFDLVQELRKTVDKKKLETIYSTLTEQEKKFIAHKLQMIEKLSAPKLSWADWQGDSLRLKKLLHKRGINRLAAALSEGNPDFVWYISYILDKGRGEILMRLFKKKWPSLTAKEASRQVLETLDFLGKIKP